MNCRYDIEIVTHCWSGTLPFYADMLKFQLSSLVNFPPRASGIVVLYAEPQDHRVWHLIDQFQGTMNLDVVGRPLDKPHLFRRAIGRNISANLTSARIVFFTDVDYSFGDGAIDAIVSQVTPDDELKCPAKYMICKDHATGDRIVENAKGNPRPRLDPTDFIERKQTLAIGGLQIIGGDTIRRIGYLGGTKWTNPVDPSKGFRSCKCDKAFRRMNNLSTTPIDVPNIFRLRHTTKGRDYNLDRKEVGAEAW